MRIGAPSWSLDQWLEFFDVLRRRLDCVETDTRARRLIADASWQVIRRYSTSFFIVTRFLPRVKRRDVEIIYAAVRYPDEVVDTFPLDAQEKYRLINQWRQQYCSALEQLTLLDSVRRSCNPIVAGFADLVRRYGIPAEYYHAFLDAMECDIQPRTFDTFEDLIEGYVYGSAIVVGYFLAYVYGVAPGHTMAEALEASRALGIALQLTNFLRDVGEDHHRSRCYVPHELMLGAGISYPEFIGTTNQQATAYVVRRYAQTAWKYYRRAEQMLGVFSHDCIAAIDACIKVYSELTAILEHSWDAERRASVPWRRKLAALPRSKYWVLPLALITPEYGK